MTRISRILYSIPAAAIFGVSLAMVLVFLILKEKSVQPLGIHSWTGEMVSPPLEEGVVLTQQVDIPEGLDEGTFQLALFFGCRVDACRGSLKITLSQGDNRQSHLVENMSVNSSLRKRFRFTGFRAGKSELRIEGLPGNTNAAPGLVYFRDSTLSPVHGTELPENATALITWFKEIEGSRKWVPSFPNRIAFWLWVLPFAGIISVAWASLGLRLEP